MKIDSGKPICPKDRRVMGKAGGSLSGTHWFRTWSCNKCGTTATKNRWGKREEKPAEVEND